MINIHLVYISLSGNTESFVKRLSEYLKTKNPNIEVTFHSIKKLVKENIPFYELHTSFIAFLPTYLEGGNGLDNGNVEILTTDLKKFLEYHGNYKHCMGIVGSGNKNFNHQYCLTAKQYAKYFDIPMLDDFELRGLQDDIVRIGDNILAIYQ